MSNEIHITETELTILKHMMRGNLNFQSIDIEISVTLDGEFFYVLSDRVANDWARVAITYGRGS